MNIKVLPLLQSILSGYLLPDLSKIVLEYTTRLTSVTKIWIGKKGTIINQSFEPQIEEETTITKIWEAEDLICYCLSTPSGNTIYVHRPDDYDVPLSPYVKSLHF